MFRRSLVIIFVLLALPVAAATWVLAPVFIAGTPSDETPPAAKSSEAPGATEVAKLPDLSALAPRTPTAEPARFDVARVDPNGWSVFAGTAPANTSVIVTADGVTVGTAKADENGEWSLSADHRFASANPVLAVSAHVGAPPSAPSNTKVEPTTTTKAAAKDEPKTAAIAMVEKPAETARAPAASSPQISAAEATKGMMQKLEDLVAAARVEEATTAKPQQAAKLEQQVATTPAEPAPAVPAAAAAPEMPKSEAKTDAAPARPAEPQPQAPAQAAAPITASPPTAEKAQVAVATQVPAAPSVQPTSQSQPAAKPVPVPVPVPMQFVFREATFTEDGRKAADLLVEYLRLKKPTAITMTGHADERGSDSFNLVLSRDRLETVAEYLRANGYRGQLSLHAKGRAEPYSGVDRKLYSRDALYQLDRRVEVLLEAGQAARAAGTASSESLGPIRN